MNVLDLFSGIGGFSLGLERAGFKTVAFCEIESYCRAVLRKHWPDVPIFEDVRTLHTADVGAIDLICGGFPCQDISNAGKRAGIEGSRSGLWSEFARLIGEIRPRYVIVENVAALLGRGMGRVLGDLAEIGYDTEWEIISAADVGALHRRERVWIVAYPNGSGCIKSHIFSEQQGRTEIVSPSETLAYPCGALANSISERGYGGTAEERREFGWAQQTFAAIGAGGEVMAHSASKRCGEEREYSERYSERIASRSGVLANTECRNGQGFVSERHDSEIWRKSDQRPIGLFDRARHHREWAPEPDVGRVAHGVPSRVDRLRGLGNAIVPLIAEIIGRAITQKEQQRMFA